MRDEQAKDDHGWADSLHPTAEHKHCGAGGEALATSLISPKSGPRQALLDLVMASILAGLSSLHMYTKALSYSEITPRFLRQKKKRAKPRFLVPGPWLEDCTLLVSDAATRRSTWPQRGAMSRRLHSTPGPCHMSGSLFSSSCGCSLTPNRDHRELPKGEKKTRRSNAEPLAAFPTLSLPGCQETTNPYPPMWKEPYSVTSMQGFDSLRCQAITLQFLIGLAHQCRLLASRRWSD